MTTLIEVALRAGQGAGGDIGQAVPLAIAFLVFLLMAIVSQRRLFVH